MFKGIGKLHNLVRAVRLGKKTHRKFWWGKPLEGQHLVNEGEGDKMIHEFI
jgi:hypothetical protein